MIQLIRVVCHALPRGSQMQLKLNGTAVACRQAGSHLVAGRLEVVAAMPIVPGRELVLTHLKAGRGVQLDGRVVIRADVQAYRRFTAVRQPLRGGADQGPRDATALVKSRKRMYKRTAYVGNS